jgi:hypothetical protein
MLCVPVLPLTGYYLSLKIPPELRIRILNQVVLGVVDRHRYDIVPEPDPTFHFDIDPAPDPTSTFAHVAKS